MTTRTGLPPGLRPIRRAREVQLVVTPGSGSGRALSTAEALARALRGRRFQVRMRAFDGLDALRSWAAGPVRRAPLVAVGGDTTLSTAAEAAIRRGVPFLPVPCGFGNLFALALGYQSRVDRVCDTLERGCVVTIDAGIGDQGVFLCHESYGLIADIQRRVEAVRRRPRARWARYLAYCRAAVEYLLDGTLPRLRVVVGGRTVSRTAAVVVVANVHAYGPWLDLTPGASPVDGLFDVFVLEGRSKAAVLRRLIGRHLRLGGPIGRVHRGRDAMVVTPDGVRHRMTVLPRRLSLAVSVEQALALAGPPAAASARSGAARRRRQAVR